MMTELFLTAMILCSTEHATCSSFDAGEYTQVNICGIVPDNYSGDLTADDVRQVEANIDGNEYFIEIRPICQGT